MGHVRLFSAEKKTLRELPTVVKVLYLLILGDSSVAREEIFNSTRTQFGNTDQELELVNFLFLQTYEANFPDKVDSIKTSVESGTKLS